MKLREVTGLQDKIHVEDLSSLLQRDSEIPAVVNDMALANLLGIKKQTLWWARIKKNELYTTCKIPKGIDKKTGKPKFRVLNVPNTRLKYIQRQINHKLFKPVLPILPDYITGFRPGFKTTDTARIHSNRNIVVSLDIENFFPSIKQWHIEKAFQELFGYPQEVCRLLSELVTFHNFMPQGAPTSPTVANFVGYVFFDKQISELCKREGFDYTRYADDITISTDKEYPKTETELPNGKKKITSDLDPIIDQIIGICAASRFKINRRKTKVMRKAGRQWVLGQVVNVEPNILKEEYNKLRAIIHNIDCNGVEHEADKNDLTSDEFIARLRGKLSYLKAVNEQKGTRLIDNLETVLRMNDFEPDKQKEIIIDYEKI